MRKLFWPLAALTVLVGVRHVVMTAWLTDRSVRLNLERAARLTDPDEQATYLERVLHTLDSYGTQVSMFQFIDRHPKTQALNRLYASVGNLLQAAKYSSRPSQTARVVSQQILALRHVSVAVIDAKQKTTSLAVFWVLAGLTGISGLLKTMAPPE